MDKQLGAVFLLAAIAVAALIGAGLSAFPAQPGPAGPLKQFATQAELSQFLAKAQSAGGSWSGAYRTTALASAPGAEAAGAADKAFSPTNIQVAGVDEADIVKTDGTWIYALANGKVSIVRADPLQSVATIDAANAQELFINRGRLVILGTEYVELPAEQLPDGSGNTLSTAKPGQTEPAREAAIAPDYYPYRPTKPVTTIRIYDLSDPANPTLARELTIDGWYQDSRLIGDTMYAISSSPVYHILPLLSIGGASRSLALSEVYYSDLPDSSYEFTTILSMNTHTDAEQAKAVLRGSSQTIYVSANNIYLTAPKQVDYRVLQEKQTEAALSAFPADVQAQIRAAQALEEPARSEEMEEIRVRSIDSLPAEQQQALMEQAQAAQARVAEEFYHDADKTVIYRIAIADGAITPEATGEVPGHPLNQFSLDESSGYLRIATTTQPVWGWGGPILAGGGVRALAVEETQVAAPVTGEQVAAAEPREPQGPTNNVYVLAVADLSLTGKLEGLAPGERIYAARFLGERAYLVTFVQIDPLFVIDLSDPAAPRVLGELKIPGYSDYLHPLDDTHLIGLGKAASTSDGRTLAQGVKLALFDVSDVANPRVVASTEIGDRGTDSEALHDHHAFLFDRAKQLLVIPIQLAEIPAEQRSDSWAYGQQKWQGAYVYRITADSLSLTGRVTHDTAAELAQASYSWPWGATVHRSLYIGGTLYTLSDRQVQANALADLSLQGTVLLPNAPEPGPYSKTLPAAE